LPTHTPRQNRKLSLLMLAISLLQYKKVSKSQFYTNQIMITKIVSSVSHSGKVSEL